MQAALVELQFADSGRQHCTAADVEMGYQIFLGRDPENIEVVEDAKTTHVGDFIGGLVVSDEFCEDVLASLGNERPLPHESMSSAPSDAQKDWLLGHFILPPRSDTLLRAPNDWAEFLSILVAMPGFPIADSNPPGVFRPLDKKRSKTKLGR